MIDFKEKLKLLSNSELLEVIRSKDYYQKEFWDLAIIDAEKRGLKNECEKILENLNRKKIKVEKAKQNLPELYSDKAIIGFSFLFSSIAGAILFSQNLKTLNREGQEKVILFGVLYFFGVAFLAYVIPSGTIKDLAYILNIAGGYIITIYFGSKYYPENIDYKNKKIWKALAVAIIITVLLIGIIYFSIISKH